MADTARRVDKVAFVTKTSLKDWPKFLSGAFERKYDSCGYDFDAKYLMLNNGIPEGVNFSCDTIAVEPSIDEVLDFFKLTRDDFKLNGYDGLWYSIAELTAIYKIKAEYICYIQSDVLVTPPYDWITPGLKYLDEYSMVAPLSEVNTRGDDMFCSDHAFLIRTEEYRKPIYNIPGYMKEHPIYAGNYFEMMVSKYLHKTGRKRKIINEAWYEHPCH